MADLVALAAAGLPPLGQGIFVRDRIEASWPRFSFYAVNAWRGDREELIAAARARGAREVFLYGPPEPWRPGQWRESREYIRREARRLGCAGYVADPENGWPELDQSERRSELRALGEALRDDSTDMRVGVTFYPSMPDLRTLAESCGLAVFAIVQVFGRTAFGRREFAGWVERARGYFGAARTAIAIAGWPARSVMATAEGYARYLSYLPDAASNWVWVAAGSMPAHIRSALTRRDVGGSALGTVAWGTLALVGRPAGAVALALLLTVVALVVLVGRRFA